MQSLRSVIGAILLVSLPVLASPLGQPAPVLTGSGAVVLSADAGLDNASLSTLRFLALHQLQIQGMRMVDSPELSGVHPIDITLAPTLASLGADRLFVLTPSRLGQKVILVLEERSPDGQQVLATASLSAMALEEADMVMPRLVMSVLRREPVSETAQVSTVTAQEAIPYFKRPGESHFLIGLPVGLFNGSTTGSFGLSLAYAYETENYRLNATALGSWGNATAMSLGIGGDYLFLPGDWTPYVGGGVGYMYLSDTNQNSNGGLGLTADVGVELFRLHNVRLLAGLELLLPAFKVSNTSWDVNGNPTTSSLYEPALLAHVQLGF